MAWRLPLWWTIACCTGEDREVSSGTTSTAMQRQTVTDALRLCAGGLVVAVATWEWRSGNAGLVTAGFMIMYRKHCVRSHMG